METPVGFGAVGALALVCGARREPVETQSVSLAVRTGGKAAREQTKRRASKRTESEVVRNGDSEAAKPPRTVGAAKSFETAEPSRDDGRREASSEPPRQEAVSSVQEIFDFLLAVRRFVF